DTKLPALNALRNLYFALAGEQRDRAHLAQVHAHRVIGLFQGARSEVEFNVLARFQVAIEFLVEFSASSFWTFKDVDALGANGGEQIVQVIGGMDIARKQVIHLIVGEIPLLLAGIDQFLNVIKLVVKSQSANLQSNKIRRAAVEARSGGYSVRSFVAESRRGSAQPQGT